MWSDWNPQSVISGLTGTHCMQGTSLCLSGPEEWSVWTHRNSPQRLFVCLDQTVVAMSLTDQHVCLDRVIASLKEGVSCNLYLEKERERAENIHNSRTAIEL